MGVTKRKINSTLKNDISDRKFQKISAAIAGLTQREEICVLDTNDATCILPS